MSILKTKPQPMAVEQSSSFPALETSALETQAENLLEQENSNPSPKKEQNPDWFHADKYKTIADQARAYHFLEKKLGGFTGSPENYTLDYPENYPLEMRISEEDPMFLYWCDVAKKHNLNNDLFNSLFLGTHCFETATNNNFRENELKKLGPSGDQRLENLFNWAKNNLDNQEMQALQESLQTSGGVALFEKLVGLQKSEQVPTFNGQTKTITEADLHARVGDPKYKTDPNFRKETTRMFETFYR